MRVHIPDGLFPYSLQLRRFFIKLLVDNLLVLLNSQHVSFHFLRHVLYLSLSLLLVEFERFNLLLAIFQLLRALFVVLLQLVETLLKFIFVALVL